MERIPLITERINQSDILNPLHLVSISGVNKKPPSMDQEQVIKCFGIAVTCNWWKEIILIFLLDNDVFVSILITAMNILCYENWTHPPPPSAAYIRRWTGSALVQVMTCRLSGAKPWPEPILPHCQLDTWEQILGLFHKNAFETPVWEMAAILSRREMSFNDKSYKCMPCSLRYYRFGKYIRCYNTIKGEHWLIRECRIDLLYLICVNTITTTPTLTCLRWSKRRTVTLAKWLGAVDSLMQMNYCLVWSAIVLRACLLSYHVIIMFG